MKQPGSQQGVALVMVILIVSLASILAAGMLSAQNLAIHRASNIIAVEQAWWYGAATESWVAQILKRDLQESQSDNLLEAWAFPVAFLPIDNGFISGGLSDMQGRLNLNDLISGVPTGDIEGDIRAEELLRLLQALIETDEAVRDELLDPEAVIQALRDWLDEDISPRVPNGAEDDYYLGLERPYRSANRLLESTSELMAVRGITPAIYRALLPHVSALPPGTPVNVNTASEYVLAAVIPELPLADARQIIALRDETPFETLEEFLQSDPMAGRQVDDTRLSVSSSYFQLHANVTVGRGRVDLYSLFFRDPGGQIGLLGHSKNIY